MFCSGKHLKDGHTHGGTEQNMTCVHLEEIFGMPSRRELRFGSLHHGGLN